jgi:nitrous oxidase accessory protein
VEGGIFQEHIVVDKPVSLVGVGWPVIDGGGDGDVITISADGVSVSGFVVRGSGRSISQEPAAIKITDGDGVTIRGNRVEDSYFGIYLLDSQSSIVSGNWLDLAADVPVERRGYGIYFWQVSDSHVEGNVIRSTSDGIHLEFSDGNGISENVVTQGRYGLHFMYSDSNAISGNTFQDNLAGAVLMFSHHLLVQDNEMSSNRRGATGVGILFKDCDNVFVEGNSVLRNKFGMMVEGTPQSAGATAVFTGNLLALNDTGLGAMSNSPITFFENAMIDNTIQVRGMGAKLASRALSTHGGGMEAGTGTSGSSSSTLPKGVAWTVDGRGNYWSDYRGFDGDGDGVGDRSYRPEPPFAGRLAQNETLRLFQYTLAQQAIDVAADMFPLYQYDAVLEDSGPLMKPPPGPALSRDGAINRDLLVASFILVAFAGAGVAAALGLDASRLMDGIRDRTVRGPMPPGRSV